MILYLVLIFCYIFLVLKSKEIFKSYVNPILIFSGFQIIRAGIAPILFLIINERELNSIDFEIIFYSLIEILAMYLGLQYRFKEVFTYGFKVLSILNWDFIDEKSKRNFKFIVLLMAILSFILLTRDFGLLNWILNPRIGYQFHRDGMGVYFSLFVSLILFFTVLHFSSNIKYNSLKTIIVVAIILFSLNLSGSKASVSTALIIILVFYDKNVKPVKLINVLLVGFMVVALLGVLMISQGTASGILSIIEYFDYHEATVKYFKEIHSEGIFLYGEAFLSGFYNLIPRSIWPDKPYAYGMILINEKLWPGAAELGNTPAFLSIVYGLADFGIFGLFAFNWLAGQWIRMSHDFFVRNNTTWANLTYLSNYYAILYLIGGIGNLVFWVSIITVAIATVGMVKKKLFTKVSTRGNM